MSDFETRSHQISMMRERMAETIKSKRENWARQDTKEEQKGREQSAEREISRNHSKAMYDQRRSDQLRDSEAKVTGTFEAEQEKTHRELLIQKLGAELYKHRLDEDFEDYVRRSNIDLQTYQHRSRLDTLAEIKLLNANTDALRVELRERLRGIIYEKIVGAVISIREKREDARIEQERMILENELNKDFELFMSELRHKAQNMSDEAVADSLARMKTNADKFKI